MNGKRGRCALCTINKKEIKIMKQFKKLASLLLAAVLAMTLLAGCGGRGGNVGTAVTEQSILKYINETRARADIGLSPVKNDPTLANAAAKLLEAFSQTEKKTFAKGTGYELTEEQVKEVLYAVTGKNGQSVEDFRSGDDYTGNAYFSVAPAYSVTDWSSSDRKTVFRLYQRANKVYELRGDWDDSNSFEYFAFRETILVADIKVGIAFREIDGERFALVVYDVTKPKW